MNIQHQWSRLRISTKFTVAFGIILLLLIFIAITSYSILSFALNRVETELTTSMAIQRDVLSMDGSMERARRLQRDFFLEYPEIGFEQARTRYGLAVTEEISNALVLNSVLAERVTSLDEDSLLRESVRDLTLYRSIAERYSSIFNETMLLVNSVADPVTGLETQLVDALDQLNTIVALSDTPAVEELYEQVSIAGERYLLTRERPSLQASLNNLVRLRNALNEDESLSVASRTQALDSIARYQEVAEDLVVLDSDIRSAFRDFDVQAETFDPISDNLINRANAEVERIYTRIETTKLYATITLVGCTLAALLLVVGIIQVLNRSITSNIMTLTSVTGAWQSGNRDISVQIDSTDELGQLAQGFNSMAGRINTMVDELEQRVEERTTELQTALQDVQAHAAEQERLLAENEAQRMTIHEMSVPVLPVTSAALVMPLVGALDTGRLHLIQERALQAIERNRARHLVLDVTGVPIIDTQVAQGLIEVVQSAQLLGAHSILVGVRPDVAQAIVGLGLDLSNIQTAATLQEALALVIRRQHGPV
jgi:anti-anti-sigma regulatory factor/HAMP domain-containing protein